jgi:hypothetical protein
MWNRNLKLQKQPNEWSCLPTAFAMVLDIPVAKIFETLDHDGSEVIFPDEPEPYCRRSFHIQEMIDVCMLRNIGVVAVELHPVSEAQGHQYKVPVSNRRLDYYIVNYNGVLVGVGSSGKPHAVAWNGDKIYDPNGTTYGITDFTIDTFYLTVNFNITK